MSPNSAAAERVFSLLKLMFNDLRTSCLADMIEGVVAANGLQGVKADRARAALWLAVDDSGELAPPETLDQSSRRSA